MAGNGFMLRDLHLVPKIANPFHHGWLAAHFGRPRDPVAGNDGRPFHDDPMVNKTSVEGWMEGYDTAMETPPDMRDHVLTKILTLEFE